MATILNLETASTNCSVSIGIDGKLAALVEENSANYSHAEQLHLFIEKSIEQAGLRKEDLDAIAVSKGPGSYTGLRIGVSAAKGLCFALDIPLIAIGTLRSMAVAVSVSEGYIIPVLDARRMEVYAAIFDSNQKEIKPTWAEIVESNSFGEYMDGSTVHIIGSGAEKCKNVLDYPKIQYDTALLPSARNMISLAEQKYQDSGFENVAYFEPYYLKDFIVTQPQTQNPNLRQPSSP